MYLSAYAKNPPSSWPSSLGRQVRNFHEIETDNNNNGIRRGHKFSNPKSLFHSRGHGKFPSLGPRGRSLVIIPGNAKSEGAENQIPGEWGA